MRVVFYSVYPLTEYPKQGYTADGDCFLTGTEALFGYPVGYPLNDPT